MQIPHWSEKRVSTGCLNFIRVFAQIGNDTTDSSRLPGVYTTKTLWRIHYGCNPSPAPKAHAARGTGQSSTPCRPPSKTCRADTGM